MYWGCKAVLVVVICGKDRAFFGGGRVFLPFSVLVLLWILWFVFGEKDLCSLK